MNPMRITACTLVSAAGRGRAAHVAALRTGATGLRKVAFDTNTLDCWLGEVSDFDVPLTGALAGWDCRNNRLAGFALDQDGFVDAVDACRARYGSARIGVFIGTSTSGVHHTELAYRARDPQSNSLPAWFDQQRTQNIFSVAAFVALRLGLRGPALAISTACSSSAKAFAAARRSIASGTCDAAVVGGVDSLCLTTLYGFNSLQLISADICRPADSARMGISIGEAGGFALLDPRGDGSLALLGYGETSDAFHMSSPQPEGRGAIASMRRALAHANAAPHDVDYINLHGTGTQANDAAESHAVCEVFGTGTACSSTKGWTGHTLGAAGMVEACISLLALEHSFMPRSLNTRIKDPAIGTGILLENRVAPVKRVLSNSFGFGGSNCSLLFGSLD